MSTLTPPRTRSLSLLVVEDNRDGADCLALFLRHSGYKVRVALDGVQAVEAVRTQHFDAVLSDIGLPGKNGYEVGKAVRRLIGIQPLLVAITAYDTPIVRETAREAGFDYFFTKPADPDDFDRLLQEHAARLAGE